MLVANTLLVSPLRKPLMKHGGALILVLILTQANMLPAIAQTVVPERPVTITLYSPQKYKIKNAPPESNGRQPGDHSRAHLDLTTGTLNWKFGRINLYYSIGSLGGDPDWFSLSGAEDDRSVIKDLGELTWYDSFKVPALKPLPVLKPGKKREIKIDVSGKPGSDGSDGASGQSAGIYESVMGAELATNGRRGPPNSISTVAPETSATAAPKKSAPPISRVSLPVIVRAVLGHMYVVHVVTDDSDFYVLIHVDGLVRGDNCTVSWMRLSGSQSPSPPIIGGSAKIAPANGGSADSESLGPTISNAAGISQSKTPALARTTDEQPATHVAIEKPPVLAPANPGVPSALTTPERPRLRNFGSSLDSLKWDPDKQAAVEVNYRSGKTGAAAAEDVVRVETRLVVSNVLVLDQKRREVQGLTQSDFVVTEDSQPQQIAHFALGDDVNEGRSIVLILDYSDSMLPNIAMSTAAAKNLVDQLGPKDRMAIVTDDVDLLVDFIRDKTQLKVALGALAERTLSGHAGRSAQFSALLAALRELFDEEDIRPIVVFQTDGDQITFMQPHETRAPQNQNVPSKMVQFSLDDVNVTAEQSRATIYTVIPGPQLIGLPADEQIRRIELYAEMTRQTSYQITQKNHPGTPPPRPLFWTQQAAITAAFHRLKENAAAAGVAEITGGRTFYLEKPEQANDIYSQILSDVNRRYVIEYYPTNKASDAKRRKVVITVRDHPEYIVEGRKTYLAPGPQ